MENKKIEEWKNKDELLVSKIKDFCNRHKKNNISRFNENEYLAHKKMLVASGRKFRKEIELQTLELLKLRQNSLLC